MDEQTITTVRLAQEADVPVIYRLILELAEYEKLMHTVEATEEWLRDALFGPRPAVELVVAEAEQEVVGFALFFQNVSTFRGCRGLYIEDLYVRPAHRGRGIGNRLLHELARVAGQRGWGMMEWRALDWNEPAIEFYRALGAEPLDDWTVFRLGGTALERMIEREGT